MSDVISLCVRACVIVLIPDLWSEIVTSCLLFFSSFVVILLSFAGEEGACKEERQEAEFEQGIPARGGV